MRAVVPALLVALVVAATFPVTADASGDVVITEVHPRPASDGREFIELRNDGASSVQLEGWNLTDGINTFTFPAWTLAPGAYVVVWGGGNQSTLGPTWKANVWNNGGDDVRLMRPDGTTVHEMTYGTEEIPVPSEGMSLHGPDGWTESNPTPGQSTTAHDGSATATVQDVAPEASWFTPPSSARPGSNVTIGFQVQDANGDDLDWALQLDGGSVRNGTTAGDHHITVPAPEEVGDWNWRLDVQSTTHHITIEHTVTVSTGPFRIDLPPEGIHFPALAPGDQDMAASAAFTILHVGDEAAVPRMDISPFQGPGANVSVDGNLQLQVHDGTDSFAVTYDGPLQALPTMAPGEQWSVTLVLEHVPDALPAGDYRSSFTVVE